VIDKTWTLIQTGNLTPTSVPLPQERSGNRDVGIAIESKELADYFTGLLTRDKRHLMESGDSSHDGTEKPDPKYIPYDPVPRIPVLHIGGGSGPSNSARQEPGPRPARFLPVHSPDNYVDYVSQLLESARESIDIVEPYIFPGNLAPNVEK